MLHPIRALDSVIKTYRDYLTTEFRARDPELRQALEEALDRPGFLAQEPYFGAHHPFPQEQRWADLPLDPRLAEALQKRSRGEYAYLHQSEAIAHLLGSHAGPTVVTTGTGSGKTETFLVPVLQAAIEDTIRQRRKPGLVALILYPMNALAQDQFDRIREYLSTSGWGGSVYVRMYNRTTTEEEREQMRQAPPHILLTNYQMLEYLLVRPKDREALFANHRMRFLVLDEVHTYRGTLGTHMALLVRRLAAHLRSAQPGRPLPIPVGTSATVKSDTGHAEGGVESFFARLVGEQPERVRVISEAEVVASIPDEARYSRAPYAVIPDTSDKEALRQALVALGDADPDTPLEKAAEQSRLLWDLNAWLGEGPHAVSELVARVRKKPERADCDADIVEREVLAALNIGAALPEGVVGNLRLRAHRFVRGGWEFHRCLNPNCGKLFPKGEAKCDQCGTRTAPLYLCRACGADFWHMSGPADGEGELQPYVEANPYEASPDDVPINEWLLYRSDRWKEEEGLDPEMDETEVQEEEAEYTTGAKHIKRASKKILDLHGSFDPSTLNFAPDPTTYQYSASLYNSRRLCPGCGTTGGPRPIITRVSLGTSAAVKVLSEGLMEALPVDEASDDTKRRLLAFADSRQDAAHQARFIRYTARYDRMRQLVVRILQDAGGPVLLDKVVEKLAQQGQEARDNPHRPLMGQAGGTDLGKMKAWEEAPLLDDLAVNTRYRATLENLGLIAVQYVDMQKFVARYGPELADLFHIRVEDVEYLAVQLLDTLRRSGILHRLLLQSHPNGLNDKTYTDAADWERRLRRPVGLLVDDTNYPSLYKDGQVPIGVEAKPIWGKSHTPAAPQKVLTRLGDRLNAQVEPATVQYLLRSLVDFGYLKLDDLHGVKGPPIKMYQVDDADVQLVLADEKRRARCDTCTRVVPDGPVGKPCPYCDTGTLRRYPDSEVRRSRYAMRALSRETDPLVAEEHTAQIAPGRRKDIEDAFKSKDEAINFLACSPTLELGIDVGQLDAVVLRNVPPRPDNYAQRGGRAGRRSRVGLVLSYTRSTPHDQYFFDHPDQMIAGAVPAPAFGMGNRDALVRHVNAIACGLADPGLAGRMGEYVTFTGEVEQAKVDELLAAIEQAIPAALTVADDAFSDDVLKEAGFTRTELAGELRRLPGKIKDAIDRTAVQVRKLRDPMEAAYLTGQNATAFQRTVNLINQLLGNQTQQTGQEASDTGSAYPLRRLAEFGILPGYEFPVEPATLRLLGDKDEWSMLSTSRQFGLRQYQPGAPVYARGKRWKVIGLDVASPWNQQEQGSSLQYQRCHSCQLIFDPQVTPTCPRCHDVSPGKALPAYRYAGFLAITDESTVSDEEERIANADLVEVHPSWQAEQTAGKWALPEGWRLEWRRGELVRWINEGRKDANGNPAYYMLCSQCGKLLTPPEPKPKRQTNKAPARGNREDEYGHGAKCPRKGQPGDVGALYTDAKVETLRLTFPWAGGSNQEQDLKRWAITLGESLLMGAQHYFALSPTDLSVEWEGIHTLQTGHTTQEVGVITFIDPNVGGSGYLKKLAAEFDHVAQAALNHLDHEGCDTACYRCLKSYYNQRRHRYLCWPVVTSTLEGLALEPPEELPLTASDVNDPATWREAFAAGCGSPLEYQCLKVLEQAGLSPTKQYPIGNGAGQAFTIADFAFPDKKVAIYVDGLAFHTGDRLRRDRAIESRLSKLEPPWTVIRLTARDIYRQPDATLSFIQHALNNQVGLTRVR